MGSNQPIDDLNAGAQVFVMDHTKRERAITQQAGPVRQNAAGTNTLTCLANHGRAVIFGHSSDDRPTLHA
jgi:hypothetical protein